MLGLDDQMSRDHDWGCRLTLLVDQDARDQVPRISQMLEEGLPERFGEFPVRFPVTWDSAVSHQIEVATVTEFAASRLGADPTGGLSVLDWLSVTGQSVLEVTAGPVFTDRTRTLAAVRTLLAWYPPDVERYVLAAGWQRLCQSLQMVGRTAETGDELGSRLLSARLAADLLGLAFSLSRRWAPYAKWRGTAFRSLPVAARLGPQLDAAAAPGWRERENALATACEVLLSIQREQGHPAPGSAVIPFFDRPYRTVDQQVPQGLIAAITDPMLHGCRPWWARLSSGPTALMSCPAQPAARPCRRLTGPGPAQDDDTTHLDEGVDESASIARPGPDTFAAQARRRMILVDARSMVRPVGRVGLEPRPADYGTKPRRRWR